MTANNTLVFGLSSAADPVDRLAQLRDVQALEAVVLAYANAVNQWVSVLDRRLTALEAASKADFESRIQCPELAELVSPGLFVASASSSVYSPAQRCYSGRQSRGLDVHSPGRSRRSVCGAARLRRLAASGLSVMTRSLTFASRLRFVAFVAAFGLGGVLACVYPPSSALVRYPSCGFVGALPVRVYTFVTSPSDPPTCSTWYGGSVNALVCAPASASAHCDSSASSLPATLACLADVLHQPVPPAVLQKSSSQFPETR
jgi:hypothetical protein